MNINEIIDSEILKLRRKAGNSIRALGWTWFSGYWRKIYRIDGKSKEIKFKDPLDACKWLRNEIPDPNQEPSNG